MRTNRGLVGAVLRQGARCNIGLFLIGLLVMFGEVACASDRDAPSLAAAYEGRLKIGAAIESATLKTGARTILADQFNTLAAENAMKPEYIQPREGRFNFTAPDAIVNFARQNGMAVRGHTLLWYRETPDWFWVDQDGRPASRGLVLARLKRHIETVVGRYKGKIYAWDVVNEPLDGSQPSCLRNEKWFQVVGPDYLDWAFRFAHAADPDARLFLNEYTIARGGKLDCFERVVKGLIERGVPIHGVGDQLHMTVFSPSDQVIDESLARIAGFGLEVEITELDMSLFKDRDRLSTQVPGDLDQLLALQAERYGRLMKIFLKYPKITGVTWWGVTDNHTWLNLEYTNKRRDYPLLFDRQLRPKAAYWSVLEAAKK